MTETFIAHVNGSFACYQTRTGVDRAFIGCTHDTPREAITHTVERKGDTFDARDIRDHLRVALVNHPEGSRVPGTCPFCGVMSPFPHLAGCPRGTASGGASRSEPDRTPPQGRVEEDSGPTPNRAPGHPADGPRRPAPTGVTPPAPVGAPDLGLVP